MKKKIYAISIIITALLAFALSACAGKGKVIDPGEAVSFSRAADYIEHRAAELDSMLYVYKDHADGFNNFTQEAFMGDSYSNIPEMNEAAEGYSGTGIEAYVDFNKHAWSGYMFLNGLMDSDSPFPYVDYGNKSGGRVDLTGAEKLIFFAKGAKGGEKVEFFVSGLGWDNDRTNAAYPDSHKKISSGAVSLSSEWRQYEIKLPEKGMDSIGCGFGWMASDANNGFKDGVHFYLDEIRFEFSKSRGQPIFLQSYASAAPDTEDGIINNFAYLYDNAIASLALSYEGKHERARLIADAIVYAFENDRYYSDGRLRNAYSCGNPKSSADWQSPKGKEFARMPGFYNSGRWYEDLYAASTSAGNMAWAALALMEAAKNAPKPDEYIRAAIGIGDFILTLKEPLYGGFTGGYEGWDGKDVKETYKSTEHNIDLISMYDKLYDLTKIPEYADAARHAERFVLSMYDGNLGGFYTGTVGDGITINKDVLPLDCNTWAILALKSKTPDLAETLGFIENNFAIGQGYDFNADRDGVWFEGTAQAALVYKISGNNVKYAQILKYLEESMNSDGSITAADRDKISTGFTVTGTDSAWEYGKRTHIGATAWLAFAQGGFNPL